VREDKSIEEASTSDFLASLYRKQEAKAQANGQPNEIDDLGEDLVDE
jgi:DNA ligase-1